MMNPEQTDVPSSKHDVSIVIPCYNSETFVARAIESVLHQVGVFPEVIVIDDGSTDDSLEVIRGFEDRVIWETGPNQGACAARNRGLEIATSPYVMFLDADDLMEGAHLCSLMAALENGPVDLAIGSYKDDNGSGPIQTRCPPRTADGRSLLIDWLNGRYVPPCGLLWRASYVRKLGGWREHLLMNQDGDLVFRAAVHGARIASSLEGSGIHWDHDSSFRISRNVSDNSLMSSLSVLTDLAVELGSRFEQDKEIRKALSTATHGLEKRATLKGLERTARRIQAERKSLGFPRYEGSIFHKLICTFLGLKNKEKLSLFLHKLV